MVVWGLEKLHFNFKATEKKTLPAVARSDAESQRCGSVCVFISFPVALKWTSSAQIKRKQHKNNETQKKKKKKALHAYELKIINIPIATNLFKYERVGTRANMSTFLHFWLQFAPSNRFQWIPNMTLLWGFSLSVPTQTQPSADQMDIYSWMFLLCLFFFGCCCLCSTLPIFFFNQPTCLVSLSWITSLDPHQCNEAHFNWMFCSWGVWLLFSQTEESDWITASYLFMTVFRM